MPDGLQQIPPALWVVIGGILLIVLLLPLLRPKPDPYPYEPADALFTESERIFLLALDEAVGDEYRILGKVRLADVIQVAKGTDGSHWQSAFNRIRAKHLDFVGCDPDTLEICWVLELDDVSHNRPERQQRDRFLEAALERAGVPLIRIPVGEFYEIESLRDQLFDS